MESVDGNGGGGMQLVSELGRVLELVRQLQLHLHAPSYSSSPSSVELCRNLAAQIVALTDQSIGIVVSSTSSATAAHFPDTPSGQLSGTPSPLSGVSDHQAPFGRGGKKRKTSTAMWRSQVRVSGGGGAAEGPGDVGHSWRKYGQKDILGAKHPRAYYRCTHRNSQGCTATKQVQRADHDPALFDVVYHGDHTCSRSASAAAKRPHAQTLLQSLSAGLMVNTDGSSLNATATPLTPENLPAARGVSPSPAGSEYSNGLAASPYPVVGYGEWPFDGDLQEVVSAFAAVSASPEPAMDPDYLPYFFEFDPSFASLFP